MRFFRENGIIFSNSQPRLGTRKINGGRKFTEIKVQKPRVLMCVNRLKFGKISRKDLLGTKMCEVRLISPKKQIKVEKQTKPYLCLPNYQTKQMFPYCPGLYLVQFF